MAGLLLSLRIGILVALYIGRRIWQARENRRAQARWWAIERLANLTWRCA